MTSVLTFFGGSLATIASYLLARKAKAALPGFIKSVSGFSLTNSIEQATGVDIPDRAQPIIDQFIRNVAIRAAAYSETCVVSASYWRKVIALITGTGKLELLTMLYEWMESVDWKGNFMASIPEELLPYVNMAKKQEATRIVGAAASLAYDKDQVEASKQVISEAVDNAAVAIKLEPSTPKAFGSDFSSEFEKNGMTKELAARMSEAHRLRMERLGTK